MKEMLYKAVKWIARIHDGINRINDNGQYGFTDKQLHFFVIGILGLGLTMLLYPLFKALVRHEKALTITWIYVFTVLIVITFAIEIGQGFTHTGTMDFDDIVSGIFGFVIFFAIFALIRGIIHLISYLMHRYDNR